LSIAVEMEATRVHIKVEKFFFIFVVMWSVLVVGGCGGGKQEQLRVCAGAGVVSESVGRLARQAQRMESFKANGFCEVEVFADGKRHKESFPVKLWVNPPSEMRLQGNVAFNARGIDIGSNKDEFWVAMKPKEVGNSYFWGLWSETKSYGNIIIVPQVLLECFGLVNIAEEDKCSLSNEGPFDVLSERDDDGDIIKRIYVYSCDYRVSRIEYFDRNDNVIVSMELSRYKKFSGGLWVPTRIDVSSYGSEGAVDSFRIVLKSVKAMEFSDRQRGIYFSRPEPRGFKKLFKIEDGTVVERE